MRKAEGGLERRMKDMSEKEREEIKRRNYGGGYEPKQRLIQFSVLSSHCNP